MKRKQINKLQETVINAIYSGDLDMIARWQNNENIDVKDSFGKTAIFHAVLVGSEEVTKQLLKSHPNLNIKDTKGWSPLHYAVQDHLIKIANLLIENGAQVELKDNYGNTPLWRAVFSSQGKGEMIKALLSKGANPDNENDSNISPIKLANTIANYDIKQFFE